MTKYSGLERQMLTYFGLIAAASLLITFEFAWAVKSAMVRIEAPGLLDESHMANHILSTLRMLRNKAFLMGAVQATVTFIILVMLIRRITAPLQQMIEQAKFISEGDLSRTIPKRRNDEIGLLGDTINGLTSNIQEIVMFGLSMDSEVHKNLEELRVKVERDADALRLLNNVDGQFAAFRNILESFELFPAPTQINDMANNIEP